MRLAIEDLIYRQSGLLGVSGISSDMRTLRASSDPAAREAIALFVYRIVREIGSLTAALGRARRARLLRRHWRERRRDARRGDGRAAAGSVQCWTPTAMPRRGPDQRRRLTRSGAGDPDG